MQTFTKSELTIPNKLYGPTIATAYVAGGLAVAKLPRGKWSVYRHACGTEVYHRLQRDTMKDAKAIASALLGLIPDWDGREWHKDFQANVGAIREIADACPA
jgi:hypothetical protein